MESVSLGVLGQRAKLAFLLLRSLGSYRRAGFSPLGQVAPPLEFGRLVNHDAAASRADLQELPRPLIIADQQLPEARAMSPRCPGGLLPKHGGGTLAALVCAEAPIARRSAELPKDGGVGGQRPRKRKAGQVNVLEPLLELLHELRALQHGGRIGAGWPAGFCLSRRRAQLGVAVARSAISAKHKSSA